MREIVELRRNRVKLTAEDIISALAILITLKPVPKELLSPEQAALVVADWRAKKAEIEAFRLRAEICYSGSDMANAAEVMRAKCEAIADGMAVSHSGMGPIEMRRKIRDAIAALKGDRP